MLNQLALDRKPNTTVFLIMLEKPFDEPREESSIMYALGSFVVDVSSRKPGID